MPDLDFHFESVCAQKFTATPLLIFKIKIAQADGATPIHTIALNCQIRIEPARRQYDEREEHRLIELFGRREQWNQTLRSMLWTHATAMVPAFVSETVADPHDRFELSNPHRTGAAAIR